MAGLFTFQSSPKGSKRDKNGQSKCFWPFGTLLGRSATFWTISNNSWFVCSEAPPPNPTLSIWGKNSFLSEMIQKGPDRQKGLQMVNIWVDHFDPFWTLLDARKCQNQDTLITLTSWVKGTSPFHIQPSNSAHPVGWAEGKSKNLILPRKPLAPYGNNQTKSRILWNSGSGEKQ